MGQVVKTGQGEHEVILYQETKEKYRPYVPDIEMILPPLTFTEEQSIEIVDLETVIKDYVQEIMARFVIGDLDLDKDWDNYLKELEKMNIKSYLEIYQEAYDVYNN